MGIENESQYEEALERIYQLMQDTVTSHATESDELENLVTEVREYEHEHYPVL